MDWPTDLIPYQWDFHLQTNSRVFRSPITRTRQVLIGQGPMWVGTGQFRFSSRRLEQRFEALLDKLKGQAETVNVWDFANKFGLPLGPALDMTTIGTAYWTTPGSPGGLVGWESGGSPTVISLWGPGTTAGFTVRGDPPIGAETVVLKGAPLGTTPLYAGDQVQIGSFMYRLVEDASAADALNLSTLTLNRGLVEAAGDGDTIITTRPRTPMQLLDDDQSRRGVGVDHVREWTVSLVEVLN